jgi:energy-coupling factor transporter ATP-binding protein EcfA2
MILKKIILQNFRGYKNRHEIPVNQLTAFIGKNDSGKSTIFDALAIFFDHPLGRIDVSDVCVHLGTPVVAEIRIGCVFDDLPSELTIDASSKTTLAGEYLLNEDNCLEIHKIWDVQDGAIKKQKVFSIANHPTANMGEGLLAKKNADLKKIADSLDVDASVDRRSNVALRKAIWECIGESNLSLSKVEIQLDKDDAKIIWDKLLPYLPEYALFRADRASTDEDSEVQDPLKIAIQQAIKGVEAELNAVKEKVEKYALGVAGRTVEKLKDFDFALASQLTPHFKQPPKWDSLFKLSLTGDDEIPINKRGSGVRRVVLFSFFRAEAERLREEREKKNIIYAIEEPETAQHPNNQVKLFNALQAISEEDGCQVMLTTHVPSLAQLLPTDSIRYIRINDMNDREVCIAKDNNNVIEEVVKTLGILPDSRVRVLVFVEGVNDVKFFERISTMVKVKISDVVDFTSDTRVALVPLGGGSLAHWVTNHYLKNLNLREVHIYDRDDDNPPHYQKYCDKVNSRGDGSWAVITSKREIENYLHEAAIVEGLGVAVKIDDNCDVPLLVAKATHEMSESNIAWADIEKEEDKLKKKVSAAKVKLNSDAASKMTFERLAERDDKNEIVGWLKRIYGMLND